MAASPSAFRLEPAGSTARTLADLIDQALQSPAAAAVLGAYLEGAGVTSGTWRVHLTESPAFNLTQET